MILDVLSIVSAIQNEFSDFVVGLGSCKLKYFHDPTSLKLEKKLLITYMHIYLRRHWDKNP